MWGNLSRSAASYKRTGTSATVIKSDRRSWVAKWLAVYSN